MEKLKKNGLSKLNILLMIIMDILLIQCAAVLPLFIRFDFSFMDIGTDYLRYVKEYMITNTVITLCVFTYFKFYSTLWQYAALGEMINIIIAVIVSAGINLAGIFIFVGRMPLSYIVLYPICLGVLIGSERILYRYMLLKLRETRIRSDNPKEAGINTMIIGAGEAARTLIREFKSSPETYNIIQCVIDDDDKKKGKYIQGYLVVGGREKIQECVKQYQIQEIIVAMPSANKKEIRKILEICKETNCKLKILPGIYQLVKGDVEISKLRVVQIEDLLGREPIKINLYGVFRRKNCAGDRWRRVNRK